MSRHEPIVCSDLRGHFFRDVGLNLAQCKRCGAVIMHGGQQSIDQLNGDLVSFARETWHPREDFHITDDMFGDQPKSDQIGSDDEN